MGESHRCRGSELLLCKARHRRTAKAARRSGDQTYGETRLSVPRFLLHGSRNLPNETVAGRAKLEKEEIKATAQAQFEKAKEQTRSESSLATAKTSSPTEETPADLSAKPTQVSVL